MIGIASPGRKGGGRCGPLRARPGGTGKGRRGSGRRGQKSVGVRNGTGIAWREERGAEGGIAPKLGGRWYVRGKERGG